MSIVQGRAALADALSTLGEHGIRGHEYRPFTPRSGDGWPLLGKLEHGPGGAFEATWRVLVVLPADERLASDRTDELVPLLAEALIPVGFVDSFEPVALQTSGGDTFALQITIRSEA